MTYNNPALNNDLNLYDLFQFSMLSDRAGAAAGMRNKGLGLTHE